MQQDKELSQYEQAAAVLPSKLRRAALLEPRKHQLLAEEFRLRTGRPMTLLLPEGEADTGVLVEPEDLEALCNQAAEFSRYAAIETIRQGYLPIRGGGRVGLCGSTVMKDGACANLRDFSSASVRIAREKKGIGEAVIPRLFREGHFQSTLILSPPAAEKRRFSGIWSGASQMEAEGPPASGFLWRMNAGRSRFCGRGSRRWM